MRIHQLLIGAAAATLIAAHPAAAQQVIDGWELEAEDDSCSISSVSADGKTLTLMTDGKGDDDSLGFVTDGLTGVASGEKQKVGVSINGKEWIEVEATGAVLSTGSSGYMLFGFPVHVFAEGAQQGNLRIRRGTTVIYTLPMDKLLRPAQAMVACAKKFG